MFNISEKMVEKYLNEENLSSAEVEVFETLCTEDIEMVFNHGCAVGVSGFIYYNETERFFNDHADEILDMIEDYKYECGVEALANLELTRNNLTWFFVEWTVCKFISWFENQEEEELDYTEYTVEEFNEAYCVNYTEEFDIEKFTEYIESEDISYYYASYNLDDLRKNCDSHELTDIVCVNDLFIALV